MAIELIIDTDAGIDDAQAILLALGQPDCRVAAITTLSGNVHIDHVTKNVLKTLEAAGTSVSVYRGADRPLLNQLQFAEEFHGKDGLGDAGFPEPRGKLESEHAVLALVRMAAEHPGRYTLVAIGPLTNVALATRLDPSFLNNLAGFVFMGGAYEALGNTSAVAEFNIYSDPEAAAIVLNSVPKAVMVSWEVTVRHPVPWAKIEELAGKRGGPVEFFNRMNVFLETYLKRRGYSGLMVPDPLAMAVAIRPDIILESALAHVQVELGSGLARGQTVADWRGKATPQVEIVKRIDLERFWQMMKQSLGAA